MKKVLYHANCFDGFCAAWILHCAWGDHNVEYIPVQYGQDPPKINYDDHVVIVDFSYKRNVMFKIWEQCKSLVVLDHHKTAEQELAGFNGAIFDMNKSGARLAWEYLHGDEVAPWLVDYTEDRDLWRHRLPGTKEINAALRSYPFDFSLWDMFNADTRYPEYLIPQGEAILRAEQQIVDQHVRNAVEVDFEGHRVLMVNATVHFSEIAGKLAENRPFGVCYFDRKDGKRQFSLRSRDGGVDVSEIAKRNGGGGHRNAAGFERSLSS